MGLLESICQRTSVCERVDASEIAPFVTSSNREERRLARRCLAVQGLLSAADYLMAEMAESGYTDMTDMQRLFGVGSLADDTESIVRTGFSAGLAATSRGEDALALEMIQIASIDDIHHGIQYLGDVRRADEIRRAYDAIAARHVPFAPVTRPRRRDGRIRIGYVVPNLVDHTNAPSQRIENFAKYHERERFEMRVYSSEVLCARNKNHYFRRQNTLPTEQRAPQILKTFAERGVSFYATPREGDLLDMAQALAAKMRADALDVVAYQASLACPVECLVADWRVAPVQVNINIGVPMYVDGIDCTTYFMKRNYEREAEYFASRGKRSLFTHGGIDLELALPPAPTKSEIGLSEDMVVLATVGNHLEGRMSDAFITCMSQVLKDNPKAVYFVIGRGDFSRQKFRFQQAGVLPRVAFTGPRGDVRNIIRVADLYVNEFPAGGAQSVMEAMASGVPAVAMRYSNQHLHCCGAEYVGDAMSIDGHDVDAYRDLITRLIRDNAYRREAGAAARKRVEEMYSFRQCVDRFESLYAELYQKIAVNAA